MGPKPYQGSQGIWWAAAKRGAGQQQTYLFGVALARMSDVSVSSTSKVERLLARSSLAPIRVWMQSTTWSLHESAGTQQPICKRIGRVW